MRIPPNALPDDGRWCSFTTPWISAPLLPVLCGASNFRTISFPKRMPGLSSSFGLLNSCRWNIWRGGFVHRTCQNSWKTQWRCMYSTFSRRRQLHWTNDKLPVPVARKKDQHQHRGLLPANKSARKKPNKNQGRCGSCSWKLDRKTRKSCFSCCSWVCKEHTMIVCKQCADSISSVECITVVNKWDASYLVVLQLLSGRTSSFECSTAAINGSWSQMQTASDPAEKSFHFHFSAQKKQLTCIDVLPVCNCILYTLCYYSISL